MTQQQIRPMREEEAERASELVRAAIRAGFTEHYSVEVVEAVAVANSANFLLGLAPRQTNYVLIDDGRIVGMTGLKKNEVGHLFVHPDHSGRGCGRRLVAFAGETFLEAGFEDMIVLASLNAVGFYEKCGFVAEGEGSFNVANDLPMHYVTLRAILLPR